MIHQFIVFSKKYAQYIFDRTKVLITSYGNLSMVEVSEAKHDQFIEKHLVPAANHFSEMLITFDVSANVPALYKTSTVQDNIALQLYVWREVLEATGRLHRMDQTLRDRVLGERTK